MKKRILVFITSLCMIFGGTVTVFGAPVISNPDVQVAYDSYKSLETVLYAKPGDYAAVKSAYDAFETATEKIDTDAEEEEWTEVGGSDVLSVGITAAYVVSVFEKVMPSGQMGYIETAANYGDLRVSNELVENYTMLEEDGVDMDGMAAGISTLYGEHNDKTAVAVYNAAKQKVDETNDDVFAVYEAVVMVEDAILWEDLEECQKAKAEFEKVAYLVDGDDSNGELSLTDAIDLAILLGETNAEDAIKRANGAYDELNKLIEELTQASNDGEGYPGEGQPTEESKDDQDKEKPEKSPNTGDDMSVLPFALVMVAAALGMVAALRRRTN